jgi:branched-chain amino acid aminotransferase
MAVPKAEKIWFNGKFVNWDDAKVHVLAHVIHYGTAAFEGIRCYELKNGSAVFRLPDHIKRMVNSCKIYTITLPYSQAALEKACLETVKINKFKSCYIRPIVFRGYGEMGVNPLNCPVDTVIATWDWGKYLGQTALEKGVDVCVSSWTRLAPNTMPSLAKIGANYMNSQLIKMEALNNGYVEGIALDVSGNVCEGSGENIFIVLDGKIYTPPWGGSVLRGVTRDSVITVAQKLGFPMEEHVIPREMLYIADEVFFTGTAAEVTPINSIDKKVVGRGGRGPITARIQEYFLDIVTGKKKDEFGWLTPVK